MSLRGRSPKQSPLNKKSSIPVRPLASVGRLLAKSTPRNCRRFNSGTGNRCPFAHNVPAFVRERGAHRNDIVIFLLFAILLYACSPTAPSVTAQVITVYTTSAAQPWLPPLYECAGTSAVLSRVDDPSAAEIVLRLGEPAFLNSPAFQIDTEDILIVAQRQSPVKNLTLDEARRLFAGEGDPSVQVWVYAEGEDVQATFDQVVMAGRKVTPSARLAVNPEHMAEALVNEANAVGILPRRWKAGDAREVLSVATVPVLAITDSESQGVIQELLACLQK